MSKTESKNNKGILYHEVMDRLSLIQSILEGAILSHEVMVNHEPEIFKLIEKAQENLGEAYQLISEKRFEFE